MTTLLNISDTHFGTEIPAVLATLKQQAQALSVDAIILSGDLTQRARLHQFRACRSFIDSLGEVPLLTIPGNHDNPCGAPGSASSPSTGAITSIFQQILTTTAWLLRSSAIFMLWQCAPPGNIATSMVNSRAARSTGLAACCRRRLLKAPNWWCATSRSM